MLTKIRRIFSKPSSSSDIYSIPYGQRVYAIGDIHGRRDLLTDMIEQIKADVADYKGKVTFVGMGDYIDRGPDSKGVVDTLLALPISWEKVFLRGNHEQVMLDFMQAPTLRMEWLAWGGIQALESYGLTPFNARGVRDTSALAAEFDHELQETAHKSFYAHTQASFVCGNYLFVHAGVRPGVSLASQMNEDLMYIREDFLSQPHRLPYRVVFGHTIMEEPLLEHDRIGLDTGAFQSGVLTAVRLEADAFNILQAIRK